MSATPIAYGVCHISSVPIRAQGTSKSEMTSMLLFGETFTVWAQDGEWLKIRCTFDAYEGWISNLQQQTINEATYKQLTTATQTYLTSTVATAISDSRSLPILIGSSLPNFKAQQFSLDGEVFRLEGDTSQPSATVPSWAALKPLALRYLNTPYLWGGRSPFGIDCSGLTQMTFKLLGINLPRDAYQQAKHGTTVSTLAEAQPGDLAYFDNAQGHITHVGIVLEQQEVIHAAGYVRIDKLDGQGILNLDHQNYTHNLCLLKRYF